MLGSKTSTWTSHRYIPMSSPSHPPAHTSRLLQSPGLIQDTGTQRWEVTWGGDDEKEAVRGRVCLLSLCRSRHLLTCFLPQGSDSRVLYLQPRALVPTRKEIVNMYIFSEWTKIWKEKEGGWEGREGESGDGRKEGRKEGWKERTTLNLI